VTIVRKIVRADGTEQLLDRPHSVAELLVLIGAKTADSVSLRHMGYPLHVMMVDDKGYDYKQVERGFHTALVARRARKPVNADATRLYHANCRPGTTHRIVGDVAIVPDSDFGSDTEGGAL
jgi:hypothetical protein